MLMIRFSPIPISYFILLSDISDLFSPESSPKKSGTLTEGLSATGISPSTDDIWYGVCGITQGENCYLMVPQVAAKGSLVVGRLKFFLIMQFSDGVSG